MNCQHCGKLLPAAPGGHRARVYCNRVCKQAHYRRRHAISQAQPLAELQEARQRIEELEQRVEALRLENTRLYRRLDVEKRYLTDNEQRGFRVWLERDYLKKYPSTPLIEKLLADQFFYPRDTRKHYEHFLHRRKFTEEEFEEFTALWKLMLLQL